MNAKKFLPLVVVSLLAGSGCATYAPTWSEVSEATAIPVRS